MSQTARLTLDIPKGLKDTIKVLAASWDTTVKDYIVDAVVKKVEADNSLEDMFWGGFAQEQDKKSEYLSSKQSEELLNSMLNA